MADHKLADLLKTQHSLTEWLNNIQHQDMDALQHEDNEKRERLSVLNQIIGLPFDKPVQFEAIDVATKTPEFKQYLTDHGQDLCALRLIPKVKRLPKLRMRGKTVTDAYGWFQEQGIDPKQYRADFVPHPPDYSWATIFIVNQHGIFGEIIYGGHHLLTQGFYEKEKPITFSFDYKNWDLTPKNEAALVYLKVLVRYLRVDDKKIQSKLASVINASFAHNYLKGYFESADSSVGTWFIDYNRILGERYMDFTISNLGANKSSDVILRGQCGSPGLAKGAVCIVEPDKVETASFKKGDILVATMTSPDYLPIMQKAAAIVTDKGGILCHAAITAREMGVPCIVGTTDATKLLSNHQLVQVDADKGIVSGIV